MTNSCQPLPDLNDDSSGTDRELAEFTQLVRGALAHLYDHAYLENHPLVEILHLDPALEGLSRAQALRRLLLETLERLSPSGADCIPAEAGRAYAVLCYRYLDGLAMEEIAQNLGLSLRQVYREHKKGLDAFASLLWDLVDSRMEEPIPPSDNADLARVEIERLRKEAHITSLDLWEMLIGIQPLVARLAEQRGVQLQIIPAEVTSIVVGDRIMLRQAFLNVLSCALARMDGGELAVRLVSAPNGLMAVVATPEAILPNTRAETRVGSKEADLVIAEQLIEANGGYLETFQTVGGFAARVLLPVPSRATVLVIDDNAELIALLRRYLGGYQATMIGVTDGVEALELAIELCPQLIILDIMMPGIDGWEILQTLARTPELHNTPIVICSVLHQEQMALAMGARDYITKPVRQTDLLRVVQRWLGPAQLPR